MPKVKIFTQESGARHIAGSMQDQAIQPGATSIEKYLWGKRVMMTMPPFHVRTITYLVGHPHRAEPP